MEIVIEFTEELEHKQGRGWIPGGIGGLFPYDVVLFQTTNILTLKQPETLSFEGQVVTMVWRWSHQTIGVSVHTSRIRELRLKFP